MKNQILIVEDQALMRRGLSSMIRNHYPEWKIFEAEDGVQAIHKAREIRPDIILMDYRMPKLDGLKAAEIILRDLQDTKIIMVSAEENNEFLFKAVEANVSGIVAKTYTEVELLEAIALVLRGKPYLNSEVSDKVTKHIYEKNKKKNPERHHHSPLLSDREVEIVNLLAQGKSASQIAEILFISKRTVEGHKAHIRKKCMVNSTPELIRYAVSKDLISS